MWGGLSSYIDISMRGFCPGAYVRFPHAHRTHGRTHLSTELQQHFSSAQLTAYQKGTGGHDFRILGLASILVPTVAYAERIKANKGLRVLYHDMCIFNLKMHQNAFDGREPLEPSGRPYTALPRL